MHYVLQCNYTKNSTEGNVLQTTLCNKTFLRDGKSVFYNFNFYNKVKDADGDVCYYYATLNYKGTTQKCSVSVQNGRVVGWQT